MDNDKFKELVNKNIDTFFLKKKSNEILNNILKNNSNKNYLDNLDDIENKYKNDLNEYNDDVNEYKDHLNEYKENLKLKNIDLLQDKSIDIIKAHNNTKKQSNIQLKGGEYNIIQNELDIIKKERLKIDSDIKSIMRSITK